MLFTMKATFGSLLLLLMLSACASSVGERGLMFFDTEGKSRTATFMKTVGGNGKIAGEVAIDGEYALDIIRMNDDLSIAVQDNKGRSRASDLKSLSQAKSFTLFAFSRYAGTVEVDKVSAVTGICADYRSKGLKVAVADNMRSKQEIVVFRASGVMASNKREINEAYLDYSASPKLLSAQKQKLEQDKNNMIAVHYGRLEELIARGICAR